jgi:mRNA-degrading endonuclease RelE of RelBE toxin-antitoxin system
MPMAWTVRLHRQVKRAIPKLPKGVRAALVALIREIEQGGPVRGNWPNYGKLGRVRHHCHLKKGRPTYVAVWEVLDSVRSLVEVVYVGTHEKAPY